MRAWISDHPALTALIGVLAVTGIVLAAMAWQVRSAEPDRSPADRSPAATAPPPVSTQPPQTQTAEPSEQPDSTGNGDEAIRKLAEDYISARFSMSYDDETDPLDGLEELTTEQHYSQLAEVEEFADGTMLSDMVALRSKQHPDDFDIRVSNETDQTIVLAEFRLRTEDVNGRYSSAEAVTLRITDSGDGPLVAGMNVDPADREVFDDYLGGTS